LVLPHGTAEVNGDHRELPKIAIGHQLIKAAAAGPVQHDAERAILRVVHRKEHDTAVEVGITQPRMG
jgi:hypothetical protein